MKRTVFAALAVSLVPCLAAAATTPATGYIYSRQILSQFTEGCVAEGPGGVFVGVGPLLAWPPGPATRSVIFVSEGGAERTVATGLNAIGDCAYDAATDVLYVSDNGGDYSGAVTGDTVFAIESASTTTAVAVAGHELVPAGSVPFASSVALFGNDLLVTDAVGGGAGSVFAISLDTAPPVITSFAGGLDYAGGLAIAGTDVLVAESRNGTFDNQIRRYDSAAAFTGLASGPTYDHGSIDLAIDDGGNVLVTGNNTVVSVSGAGVASPLVTGLDGGTGYAAFGGGLAIDGITGRVDFAASSFSAADDDHSLHRLTPVSHLVSGRGADASECVHEFYGVALVPARPGKPARLAICQDGAACDGDGTVNDSCTFAIGFCVNVPDARFPTCTPTRVASFELLAARPESSALTVAAADVQAAAPVSGAQCFFSDGTAVPLRIAASGARRVGKGVVKVRATTGEPSNLKDTDVVKLVCQPPAS